MARLIAGPVAGAKGRKCGGDACSRNVIPLKTEGSDGGLGLCGLGLGSLGHLQPGEFDRSAQRHRLRRLAQLRVFGLGGAGGDAGQVQSWAWSSPPPSNAACSAFSPSSAASAALRARRLRWVASGSSCSASKAEAESNAARGDGLVRLAPALGGIQRGAEPSVGAGAAGVAHRHRRPTDRAHHRHAVTCGWIRAIAGQTCIWAAPQSAIPAGVCRGAAVPRHRAAGTGLAILPASCAARSSARCLPPCCWWNPHPARPGAGAHQDIADIEGIRDNRSVGYGLVVGLNGTGDRLANAVFTRQSLIGMLERLGVNTRDQEARLDTKNVAAVMVTANLPPFSRQGTRIDVAISALGDATNLTGGTLLVTPLLGADGEVYAVAQGGVATGAIAARGAAQSVTRGVPTAGRIANGAVIERENRFVFAANPVIRLSLRNPDLTTARRVAEAVNRFARGAAARATDPATIQLQLPGGGADPVAFITAIEQLRVRARPCCPRDHRRGAGHHRDGRGGPRQPGGDRAGEPDHPHHRERRRFPSPTPSARARRWWFPAPMSRCRRTARARLGVLDGGVTLQTLVNALNSLGVSPRDIIGILQAIKAGAHFRPNWM